MFLFLFSISAQSYEAHDGKVSGSVGAFTYQSNFLKTESIPTSPILTHLGLLINGDINDTGSLEISIFHMYKTYLREENNYSLMEKVQLMHISMGYRYWLNTRFSTALGFYSSYPMDEAVTVYNTFPIEGDIKTSARDKTEYGFDISIQTEIWGNSSFSIFADVRYALSITNENNEKGDHYGLLLGLKFLVQEKYPESKTSL